MFENLFPIIVFLVLATIGYFAGSAAEKRHYRSIQDREQKLRHILVMSKRIPPLADVQSSELVTGSVVISVDYFKRFLAGLRKIVGGRLHSYESLLDRARREAILRMQQQAKDKGAFAIYNLRLETSSISKGQGDTVGSIEVLAYGTALFK